jgi:hypothetical protein
MGPAPFVFSGRRRMGNGRRQNGKGKQAAERTPHAAARRGGRGRPPLHELRGQECPRHMGLVHTKDRGDLTELEFMVAAKRRRYPVGKPFGDNQHYDVLVDAWWKIWRVQVKLGGARHHRGYTVRSSWRTSWKQVSYSPKDVDFLAVLIDGKGIWYLIPVRALGGRKTIHLYPFGCRKDGKKRFEKYKEAWWLLEGKKRVGGRKKRKRR